ncbi:MAG: HIT family protein [Chloroflexi bacterium]|nr:HIT family protein [Chloroflexota bacterium]
MERYCIFCEIIARRAPAEVIVESDNVIVFRNQLRWVPVMLLASPRAHMTQDDLWGGELLAEVGRIAAEAGRAHCPGGFRLASNLGFDAKQSQEHAHIHVLGGTFLGDYVNPQRY